MEILHVNCRPNPICIGFKSPLSILHLNILYRLRNIKIKTDAM